MSYLVFITTSPPIVSPLNGTYFYHFTPSHEKAPLEAPSQRRVNSSPIKFESEKSSICPLAHKQPRAANALVPWYVHQSANSSPQHLLVPHACHKIYCSQVSPNYPIVGPPLGSCLTIIQPGPLITSPGSKSQVCPAARRTVAGVEWLIGVPWLGLGGSCPEMIPRPY
jgi:hypothetical protein